VTIDARHPFPGHHPLVVGAARSGLAAASLLKRHGLDVRVCDSAPASERRDAADRLLREGIAAEWERGDPGVIDGRDALVWSPGIRFDHPVAVAARERGIPVLSELELGFLAAEAPFICITGTNGKSTTTDLTGALLAAAGRRVEVCGNIGRALCDAVETVGPTGFLVVEVSSFQLETVDRLAPWVACWLNLTPDHLDRHGSLEAYAAAKQRLFARQSESDWAVWNADEPEVTARRAGGGTPLEFSRLGPVTEGAYADDGWISIAWRGGTERLMRASELRLRGEHNLSNALAAITCTLPLEISPDVLRDTLRSYRGLPHRLEPVAVIDGVEFVNDSKATNTDSLAVALQSFEEPVVLIAGGRDKGQDFAPLAPAIERHVRHLVLIGEGAGTMSAAWKPASQERASTLASAVEQAFAAAKRFGARAVLLSPGCSSFDMFRDYEDRGSQFRSEVERLKLREAHA
jgi:UDP-N-acetylmuramoylalanine--D-glutamate ligase